MKIAIMTLGALTLGQVYAGPVHGYFKPSTGTYVNPYIRSQPNNTTADNWGNFRRQERDNPYRPKPIDPMDIDNPNFGLPRLPGMLPDD